MGATWRCYFRCLGVLVLLQVLAVDGLGQFNFSSDYEFYIDNVEEGPVSGDLYTTICEKVYFTDTNLFRYQRYARSNFTAVTRLDSNGTDIWTIGFEQTYYDYQKLMTSTLNNDETLFALSQLKDNYFSYHTFDLIDTADGTVEFSYRVFGWYAGVFRPIFQFTPDGTRLCYVPKSYHDLHICCIDVSSGSQNCLYRRPGSYYSTYYHSSIEVISDTEIFVAYRYRDCSGSEYSTYMHRLSSDFTSDTYGNWRNNIAFTSDFITQKYNEDDDKMYVAMMDISKTRVLLISMNYTDGASNFIKSLKISRYDVKVSEEDTLIYLHFKTFQPGIVLSVYNKSNSSFTHYGHSTPVTVNQRFLSTIIIATQEQANPFYSELIQVQLGLAISDSILYLAEEVERYDSYSIDEVTLVKWYTHSELLYNKSRGSYTPNFSMQVQEELRAFKKIPKVHTALDSGVQIVSTSKTTDYSNMKVARNYTLTPSYDVISGGNCEYDIWNFSSYNIPAFVEVDPSTGSLTVEMPALSEAKTYTFSIRVRVPEYRRMLTEDSKPKLEMNLTNSISNRKLDIDCSNIVVYYYHKITFSVIACEAENCSQCEHSSTTRCEVCDSEIYEINGGRCVVDVKEDDTPCFLTFLKTEEGCITLLVFIGFFIMAVIFTIAALPFYIRYRNRAYYHRVYGVNQGDPSSQSVDNQQSMEDINEEEKEERKVKTDKIGLEEESKGNMDIELSEKEPSAAPAPSSEE